MGLDQIDAALRLVDREIWIVTAANSSRRGGLTATWVSQASIDRQLPVLIAGIAPNHFTAELIDASQAFAAHLLRDDQIQVAWNFADGSGQTRDKLAGLATISSEGGPPVLTDCLAWCECRVFSRYDAGDRIFYWADVVGAEQPSHGHALRERTFIRGLSEAQRQQLVTARQSDVEIQRPLAVQWRRRLQP
jgi:flavin reductase (DIM6/NTAB) family NADH-FMN oxidoreductase RutF